MSKWKALLLGTGASAVGIYNAAVDLGCEVVVVGNKSGDPLVKLAGVNNWLELDYSAQYERLVDEIDAEHFDAVIPSANDASYRMGLAVSRSRNIPGYDTKRVADGISYKHLFPSLISGTSVRIPKTLFGSPSELGRLINEMDRSTDTYVLKPCDQFSGLGVLFFDDLSQLKAHLKTMEDVEKDWVVQTCIKGQSFSVSCFVIDGEVSLALAVDEFISRSHGGVWVQSSFSPSSISDEVISNAIEQLGSLVSSQGLVDGLLHVQFIRSDVDGYPYLIEAMRRLPGDFFGFHFDDGNIYHRNYVAAYLPSMAISCTPSDFASCYRRVITESDLNGAGAFVTSCERLRGQLSIFPVVSSGGRFEGFNKKVAVVFAKTGGK